MAVVLTYITYITFYRDFLVTIMLSLKRQCKQIMVYLVLFVLFSFKQPNYKIKIPNGLGQLDKRY